MDTSSVLSVPVRVRVSNAHIVAARCRNRSEIRADADAQGLSYAEHGIRCHGNASTNAEGKVNFSLNTQAFRSRPRPDAKMPSPGTQNLQLRRKRVE